MKTRRGFVSNSSSASFVIEIDMEPESFLQDLQGHFDFSIMGKKGFTTAIKKDIEKFEGWLAERSKEKKDKLEKVWADDLKLHIKVKKHILAKIPKMKDLELVEAVLNYNYIFITKKRNSCELNASTVMYNNAEDVPELMQVIITHLAINHKGMFNVTVESDH